MHCEHTNLPSCNFERRMRRTNRDVGWIVSLQIVSSRGEAKPEYIVMGMFH